MTDLVYDVSQIVCPSTCLAVYGDNDSFEEKLKAGYWLGQRILFLKELGRLLKNMQESWMKNC